jgi:hypothetical protein
MQKPMKHRILRMFASWERVVMMKTVAFGALTVLLLGGTAAAGVTTPRAKRSGLERCAPQQARSHRQITVGLRVVRTSARRGKCPNSIAVIGGTAGDVWGFDWEGGLWESRDDLRTWRLDWRGPKDTFVERAMRTRSGHVLIEVGYSGSKTGPRRIMRSADTSARRFKTTFTLPLGSSLHFASSWGQFSAVGAPPNTVYVGEYGDHPNPVHLWASTNDGRSFKTVFSLPGENTGSPDRVRHVHGVFLDPFTKWLWVAIGDTTPEPRIGYSKDGGRTFTWITKGVYPQSRAVDLMFASDAVYWGTDVPEIPGALYRWSRTTRSITTVLTSVREPYFDARQSRGWYAQFSEISTKENDGYIGDEHVHVLVGNRAGWRRVTTPWTRTNKLGKIAPAGATTPNAAGCFWMSLPGQPGSDGFTNIKLCLGPTRRT